MEMWMNGRYTVMGFVAAYLIAIENSLVAGAKGTEDSGEKRKQLQKKNPLIDKERWNTDYGTSDDHRDFNSF